ncbi:MAG: sensor domain-containing diguanylate cyclase [Arcobacter sp.]|nr:sensor domain-containing diguanylate cyclase [Arcobacter sp.]
MYEVFDLSPYPIAVVNKKGLICNFNYEFSKVFGDEKNKNISYYIKDILVDLENIIKNKKIYKIKKNNNLAAITIKENIHKNFVLYLDVFDDKEIIKQYTKYFDIFINNTSDFIYIKKFNNNRHEFQIVSKRFASLCGYNNIHDLKGLDDFDVFPKEHAEQYFESELNIIKTECEDPFRQVYIKEDGTQGWLSTTKTLIKDNKNNAIGLFGVSRDITKIVNLENQLILESQTDDLTKVYNRKLFRSNIKRHIDITKKYKNVFSLLLIDVDNFKNINDTYGHLEGDGILLKIVFLLKKHIRTNDSIYRLGGDEFALLLPNAKEKESVEICKRILNYLENENKKQCIKFTLSIGLSEYKKNEKYKDFFERCDNALYKSKNNGRNQLSIL